MTRDDMATARSIRERELEELLKLYRMLNPDDPELERDEELSEQWERMTSDESLDIVVVEHDGALVASCMLSITENLTRSARPFGVIENVITHEDHRRNGFGTRCLREAVERAERRGCYKVILLTGSGKEWKHYWYESCGFDRDEKTGFVFDIRSR